MRFVFLLSFFISTLIFSQNRLDNYLKKDNTLNNISKVYLETYGTKINPKVISSFLQKSKIYDNEHIYISGKFKSLNHFERHILKTATWKIMKYSHYGFYKKNDNYMAILMKRYLNLKQIGFQRDNLFIISGETLPEVKSVMAYFQNSKGQVFHVLPSVKNKSFFQFKFSKQIGETSPTFELVVDTKLEGKRVANIIRKNIPSLRSNVKINYPSPHEAKNYLLSQINKERVSRGIKPLEPDESISEIALSHSKIMARKRRVFHSKLSEKISKTNYFYSNISENVGSSKHISSIHNGFLNSPAHFKNIINDSFSKIGIGVEYKKTENDNLIYVTQIFINPHNEINIENLSTGYFLNFVNNQRKAKGVSPLKLDNKLLKEASLFLEKEKNLGKIANFLSLSAPDLKRVAYNKMKTQSLFSIKNNPALYDKEFTHFALLLPGKKSLRNNSLILLASYKN